MRISLSMVFGAAIAAVVAAPAVALADGDAAKGAKVFKKCAACHVADEEKNKVGPHLMNIIDRPVASVEDYKYSKALSEYAAEEPAWTVEALDAYLRNPKGVVKGTKMAFAGLKKDDDVANIIAYLTDPAAAE